MFVRVSVAPQSGSNLPLFSHTWHAFLWFATVFVCVWMCLGYRPFQSLVFLSFSVSSLFVLCNGCHRDLNRRKGESKGKSTSWSLEGCCNLFFFFCNLSLVVYLFSLRLACEISLVVSHQEAPNLFGITNPLEHRGCCWRLPAGAKLTFLGKRSLFDAKISQKPVARKAEGC